MSRNSELPCDTVSSLMTLDFSGFLLRDRVWSTIEVQPGTSLPQLEGVAFDGVFFLSCSWFGHMGLHSLTEATELGEEVKDYPKPFRLGI